MTVTTMSHVPTPRRHGGRDNANPLTVDPRLARLILQMCLRKQAQRARPTAGDYTPRMDLYDDETQTRVTAMLELPGVARDNMSVVVRDEKLVVTGTRNSPLAARLGSPTPPQDARSSRQDNSNADVPVIEQVNPAKYRFRELKFGRFRREIDIPAGTQTGDIFAEMCDGMLLLSWPRVPASRTLVPAANAAETL